MGLGRVMREKGRDREKERWGERERKIEREGVRGGGDFNIFSTTLSLRSKMLDQK